MPNGVKKTQTIIRCFANTRIQNASSLHTNLPFRLTRTVYVIVKLDLSKIIEFEEI